MDPAAPGILSFLGRLYPDDIPDGLALGTCRLQPKYSGQSHQSLVSAANAIAGAARLGNVYIGLGLVDAALDPARSKGKASEVRAIPGIWIDIDLQTGFHGADNNPPDAEAALAVLGAALPDGWSLSLVVHSGGGLHVYLLFRELWVFESDEARDRAAQLLIRFHRYLKREFAERGWNLDNVSNLDRVLRPAPSLNFGKPKHAYDPPRPVTVVEELSTGFRVDPSEVLEFLDLVREPEATAPSPGPQQPTRPLDEKERRRIEDALKKIPADDRDTWIRVGLALKHSGDEVWGRERWDEWSRTSTKYDPAEQEKAWASLRDSADRQVNLGTIHYLARQQAINSHLAGATPTGPTSSGPPPSAPQSRPGLPPPAPQKTPPPNIPPYVPFPTDVLPEPVRSYAVESAKAIGCDVGLIVLPLLASLGAAIGTTRRIKLKDGWCEPAMIWAVTVGDSGTLKSPALDAATRFLGDIQRQNLVEHEIALIDYEADREVYKKKLKEWRSGEGDERPPAKPKRPKPRRIICEDATVEALAPLLQDNPRGLLERRDELSAWFGGFNAYRDGRGADEAHWAAMFGARELIVDRKTGKDQQIYVPCAGVCVTGGIQPDILKRHFTKERRAVGLAARILLAYPPTRQKIWSERAVRDDLCQQVVGLFKGLHQLDFERAGGESRPLDLGLTPKAKLVWERFYNLHAERLANAFGDECSVLAKIEGYVARFALIIHLVRFVMGDGGLQYPLFVDEESLSAGIALGRWFANEAARIYLILDEEEAATELRKKVELFRRKGGRMSVRDWQRARGLKNADQARKELQELEKKSVGKLIHGIPSSMGGRPTEVFTLTLDDDAQAEEGAGLQPTAQIAPPAPPPSGRADETGIMRVVAPAPPSDSGGITEARQQAQPAREGVQPGGGVSTTNAVGQSDVSCEAVDPPDAFDDPQPNPVSSPQSPSPGGEA